MTDLLKLSNVSKTFSGVTVLSGVDLTVQEGEIHALLGQNGSGKSTLIKVLSGYHAPDDGAQMKVRGKDVPLPLNPGDPLTYGIAFVHQDLGLADELSLVDNLSVGEYRLHHGWRIDWRQQEQVAAASLREFGVDDDVRLDVSKLSSPAKRALVAIARAVTHIRRHHGGGVLVLDEPTVYLPRHEVRHLQDVVRRLAADGVGVLYVTHRLDELRDFADRATVVRDGRRVGVVDIRSEGTSGLVQMITGTSVDFGEARGGEVNPHADEVLRVKGLTGGRVADVSFSLRPGEIIGLAGLVGMGQDDVLGLIFGATHRRGGEVVVVGGKLPSDPRAAIEAGVAFLPADRPRRSAAVSETVAENVTLPVLTKRFFSSGRVQTRRERQHVADLLEQFDVRPRNPGLEIARLSGGNQQKALLAKWLQTEPRVLLLDEPVQGVDVGAKAQIFDRLRETAAAGCGLVIASSEYEDLALLCDRVLILVDGQVHRELTGAQVTKDQIAAACYGSAVA
jgi:ribose transport system ATP-binding protein